MTVWDCETVTIKQEVHNSKHSHVEEDYTTKRTITDNHDGDYSQDTA